ncbi:conserved hypothetical protein [Xylanimonas cellulosilytica DSM 15894]|uniref:LigA n=1 Tax=Xylanimonas cellulosilytica (strain DSM 15894 / JCM 12276 / CECT 5975 / KCTC 9989 / LMG 20990 / NBRC 107835 / XIL07) TaxID=446471 RepID=D1BV00_XYLCX|nr:DUF4194 domain-containing protein [Xylanimonas cellulosilytica]ACZ31239.1 conserved hypothetical protein [Xylanimonas cellulosilytica DSM 15894]
MTDIPVSDGFIEPVAMEADPTELFAGDTGTLDAAARAVLVDLLRRRYLSADASPQRWAALLEHQSAIESRLHDLFVTLVVDRDRGIAYKRQVRSGEVEIPILLRDEAYTRVETVLLVHLRTLHQREQGAGEVAARVDAEELEQHVMSFLDPAETNVAARQREVRAAIARLATEGFLDEESPGRFRITPLVEVVLPVDRLAELAQWLRSGGRPAVVADADGVADADDAEADDGDTDDGDTDDGDDQAEEDD